MPRLLAYPMRFNRDGSFVTVEDGEDYYAQEIAMLMQTTPGERELVPDYGIKELAFDDDADTIFLNTQIEMFGPSVEILSIETEQTPNGTMITVEFEAVEDDDLYLEREADLFTSDDDVYTGYDAATDY